ncbi:MAG TPA: LptF/LptG family permease, partial [Gemmatimonadaceae bacterium]
RAPQGTTSGRQTPATTQGKPSTTTPRKSPATPQRAAGAARQPKGLPQIGRRAPTPSEVARAELARQGSLRRDSAKRTLPAGKAGPVPSALLNPRPRSGVATANPAIAPLPTAGQLDVYKARITDARTTMNRYEVEIQKKFALAAACVVFVIFGAPIALRFPRGGVGLVIGVSLVAFALYYVCLIAGETLADKLILNPFVAMWMANVVFTLVGVVMLVRVQRSGATARGGDASEIWDAVRVRLARQLRRVGIPVNRRSAA